jgi:hypothetical protein
MATRLHRGEAAMFEHVPVWLLTLGVALGVAACVQLGIRVASRIRMQQAAEERGGDGIGSIVGAMLGLLAFLLAFAFGMAVERRTARKDLLLAEINSIGTTWLRTDMIPEPHRSASRDLLRKYVDLRLEAAEHPERMPDVLESAAGIQRQLWTHAAALGEADLRYPAIAALYVDSLNETIDLQTSRIIVGRIRIPGVVWVTFGVLLALSSLAVGYNFGVQSNKSHWLVVGMLAISFATVLFLIFDLDRGNQGWLKVDQEPMYQLREELGAPGPSASPG